MAVEEALRQLSVARALPPVASVEAAPPETEPEPVDIEVEARKTFARLIAAYGQKRRSTIMRWSQIGIFAAQSRLAGQALAVVLQISPWGFLTSVVRGDGEGLILIGLANLYYF